MAFNYDSVMFPVDFPQEAAAIQAMGGLDQETIWNWDRNESTIATMTAGIMKQFAALPPAVAPAQVFIPAAVVTPPASINSQGWSPADDSFYLPTDNFTPAVAPTPAFIPAAVVTPPASVNSQGWSPADDSSYLSPDNLTPPISPEAYDWNQLDGEIALIQDYGAELGPVPPGARPGPLPDPFDPADPFCLGSFVFVGFGHCWRLEFGVWSSEF